MAVNPGRSVFTNDQYSDLTAATCDPQDIFSATPTFSAGAMEFPQQNFPSDNISRTPPNSTRTPSLIMESSSSEYSDFSSPSQASSFESSSSYLSSSRRSSAYTFRSSPSPADKAVVISGLDTEPWERITHQTPDSGFYTTNGGMSMGQHPSSYSASPQWTLQHDASCSLNQCSPYGLTGDIKTEASQHRQNHYSQSYNWLGTHSMPISITQIGFPNTPSDALFDDVASSPSRRRQSRKTGKSRQSGRNRVTKSISLPMSDLRYCGDRIKVSRPEEKVHKCQTGCNQSFAREEHRKRHERKHLPQGEKHLWECPIKGCDKNFNGNGISDRRDNLTQHIVKTHCTFTNKLRGHTNARLTMKQMLEQAFDPGCLPNWLKYFGQDISKGVEAALNNFDLKADIRKIADKQRWSKLLSNKLEWHTKENKKVGHASYTGYWKLIGWGLEESLHIRVVDIAPEYTGTTYKGNPDDTLDKIHPMWKAMRRGELTVTQCQNLWDPDTHQNQGTSDEDKKKTRYFLQHGTLAGYNNDL